MVVSVDKHFLRDRAKTFAIWRTKQSPSSGQIDPSQALDDVSLTLVNITRLDPGRRRSAMGADH
jgi:hypothetical protein